MVGPVTIGAPLAAVASRWTSNPDIASAYSYLRPGATPADRAQLALPVAPGLHLAGEATWSAHPGTMHGAWWSGERAARRLLDDGARGPVVVVGGGLAGLAAARLLRSTCETVVLEAGTRLGGRAATDTSLGVPAHLGAAWVHGGEGNPLAEAATRLGVRTEPTRPAPRPTVLVGRGLLAGDDLARLVGAREAIELGIEAAARDRPTDVALGSVVRDLLRRVGRDDRDRLVLWSWVRSEYEGLYAAPLDDLSLRHRAEPFMCPGANLTVLDPLDRIIADLARGLDVRMGQRVVAIEARGPRWRVTTAGGGRMEAGTVIVTAPVGALARGRIRFSPGLPTATRLALQRIGPGRVAKVVATFAEPTWAPHRSFCVVARPPVPLPVWIDVSALAGAPALAAFATADAVGPLEAASPAELLDLVSRVLALVDLRTVATS